MVHTPIQTIPKFLLTDGKENNLNVTKINVTPFPSIIFYNGKVKK